ncbi:hypothetical protein MIND_00671700 [Mycena indigotica]|uniref:Cleavage stimulation factor subunit 2 hinge domain-containing protein n=1 Tax=Mycena indigotica TaxID=2126181 RepID=A0A8H6SMR0_9AGAR|nr:uncharacterized protein MIND_00669800 [Mycena indigotica]XP_037219077.1 uncharacterized protein MIND_00671700 [Mycena indigotica]KAF7301059.1 hypothetical protein MIND_00669800 [Mycena indigotica]KAF7301077.1 hypothetical protein MIND_00671700 [Mycena indigotica]
MSKAEGDLLDLLLQLKRTTPQAAKQLLNSQPAIAYALISLMVSMNAIDIDVFQKTLASHSGASVAPPAPVPLSAIPPHMQPSSRTNTPPVQPPYPQHYPSHTPTPPNAGAYPAYNAYPQPAAATPPPTRAPPPPAIPESMLAGMSEEQRQMLINVLSMTPEQVNALPPADRTNIMQLRATLGIR